MNRKSAVLVGVSLLLFIFFQSNASALEPVKTGDPLADSASIANRRTALRCLSLAKEYAAQKDWNAVISQSMLGLAYDDGIADLWYVYAVAENELDATKAEILPLVTKALTQGEWVDYNRDGARILYADILCDTGRYKEVPAVLDAKPVLFSADAEYIRAKAYYRMIATLCVVDKDGIEKECIVYLDKRPEQPGYEVYSHDVMALSFLPIVGMELVPVSTESHRKYSVVSVLKGSIADETGFSEHDPVDIIKIQFDENKTAAFIELYTKKRKNGYMDVTIGLTAPMDSPYYF